MTQKQEEQVQKMLDDLNVLEVKARMLESQTAKGREFDESGNSLAQAAEDLRAEQLEITVKLAKMFESNGMYQMAERIKSYNLSPENIVVCLKEIVKDISELYAKAFKLMLENMKRRQKRDQAISDMEKEFAGGRTIETAIIPARQTSDVGMIAGMERAGRAMQKGLTRIPESVRGWRKKPLDVSDRSRSSLNVNLVPKDKEKDKKKRAENSKRKSSKIIYVKSSEAKAKDLANQRALKKSQMAMAMGKSAPAMAPSQMSR